MSTPAALRVRFSAVGQTCEYVLSVVVADA